MKSRGANIFCSVCHAEPWPDDPAIRETFDLTRAGDAWFCELHRAPRKRAPRPAAVTPLDAVTDFEQTLAAESARFEEALGEDGLAADFETYSGEVARALGELKKALTPQSPSEAPDDAPKNRRTPRKIKATERLGDGQVDWVAEPATAEPASEP